MFPPEPTSLAKSEYLAESALNKSKSFSAPSISSSPADTISSFSAPTISSSTPADTISSFSAVLTAGSLSSTVIMFSSVDSITASSWLATAVSFTSLAHTPAMLMRKTARIKINRLFLNFIFLSSKIFLINRYFFIQK